MKNNLALARKFRGLTQIQLSNLTGISKTSISNLEIGFQSPSLSNAISICRCLNLPIFLVFPESGDFDTPSEDIKGLFDFALERSITVY